MLSNSVIRLPPHSQDSSGQPWTFAIGWVVHCINVIQSTFGCKILYRYIPRQHVFQASAPRGMIVQFPLHTWGPRPLKNKDIEGPSRMSSSSISWPTDSDIGRKSWLYTTVILDWFLPIQLNPKAKKFQIFLYVGTYMYSFTVCMYCSSVVLPYAASARKEGTGLLYVYT